jgi:hypothetical protein
LYPKLARIVVSSALLESSFDVGRGESEDMARMARMTKKHVESPEALIYKQYHFQVPIISIPMIDKHRLFCCCCCEGGKKRE